MFKSQVSIQRVNYVWTYNTVSWNQNSNTMEPDQPPCDCPAAGIMVQQCSSATFNLLPFHSDNKKFGSHFKQVGISSSKLFF